MNLSQKLCSQEIKILIQPRETDLNLYVWAGPQVRVRACFLWSHGNGPVLTSSIFNLEVEEHDLDEQLKVMLMVLPGPWGLCLHY